MNISILKKIGFNDKEVNIYIKLFEHGEMSVRDLAESTGINRGTVYDVLKRLQDQGLVSYFHKDTKQKFVAENAEKLLELIRIKEEDLSKTKDSISNFIPQLKSIRRRGNTKPVSKYYEGKKGIKSILEDVLESKIDEYYIYSAKNASEDINSAYPDFTKKRIAKKIKVKAISLAEGGGTSGLDERRWLGTNDKSATFIIIYNDRCAFISRDELKKPVGVIIENKMIAETQKTIFKNLWMNLK